MQRILSTKKLTSTQRNYLLNADFQLIEADFIRTESVSFSLGNIGNLLLFTSKNAVKSVLKHPKATDIKKVPAICVGKKTADLLIKNQWKVLDCQHYAHELVDIILEKYSDRNITFFCGNLRRDLLPEVCKSNNIQLHEIEVYKTILQPKAITIKCDVILFFSPSGVRSFLLKNKLTDEVAICIGQTTADAVKPYTKKVIVAKHPTVENVIIRCITFFEED